MNFAFAILAAACLCAGVETEMLPVLPALKALSRLSELRPVIIVDTREQTPLPILRLPSQRGGLRTGDYGFVGGEEVLTIERKSIADLVSCCCDSNRDRFENELHRAKGYKFARLLVVGSRDEIAREEYRSAVKAKVVFSTLSMIEARYIPVVFSQTPETAAELVESWIWWSARELVIAANTLARDNGLTGKPQEAPA